MRLLIIEDNQDLSIELADFFELQGDIIDTAADGVTGLHLAVVNQYDAIILDLMLPGIDGLELCRRLRNDAGNWIPVLMLTARDTLPDRLKGFEHGADDYLVKPFSLMELKLRLTALTRRHSGINQQTALSVADLKLVPETREVSRAGMAIELTAIEFQILELLMRQSPRVVSRQNIEYNIWGDTPPDAEALRVHIHHLRNAIDKSFPVPLLHTVRGIGYQLKPGNALSA
ncbi:MAG: response regulator transcription factor [Methylobacter sp.]